MVKDEIIKEREELYTRLETLRENETYSEDELKEIEDIEARLAELAKLEKELETVTQETPKAHTAHASKSVIGELARRWKKTGGGQHARATVEVKAGNTGAITTQQGYADAVNFFESAQLEADIYDIFDVVRTDREHKFVTWNLTGAGTTTCGGLKRQMVGTPRTIDSNATKVAGYTTIDECMLADDPELNRSIRDEVGRAVAEERLAQLLLGDGEGTNLTGIANTDGVQVQVIAANPTASNLLSGMLQAIAKVKAYARGERITLFVSSDVYYRLTVTPTSYIDGQVSFLYQQAVTGDEVDPVLYLGGARVVEVTTLESGTAIAGAFKSAKVYERDNIVVDAGYTEDNFIYDLLTIRGYQRIALAVPFPQKFINIRIG